MIGELGGGRRAEIGADQQFFQFVERRAVELALGEDGADALAEFGGGTAESLLHAGEPAFLRRGRLAHRELAINWPFSSRAMGVSMMLPTSCGTANSTAANSSLRPSVGVSMMARTVRPTKRAR